MRVLGLLTAMAAAWGLSAPVQALAAQAPQAGHRLGTALAVQDPAVATGHLANGMRFLVMRNANPVHGVSVRFYVRAGSGQETEDERGAAHLLEHMAFEGTRRFPGDSLDRAFQEAGVSLGRDQNAFTDVSGVDYVLDLAEAQDGKLDLALSWLRDVGDGLGLDPAAVERQKNVVTAEYNARRNGSSELGDIVAAFMGPSLLGVHRQPAGTPQSIAALNAEVLRAFHDRWYRPDRATLIVVGDIDPASVLAKIDQAFASWTAPEPAPADPAPGRIDPQRAESVLAVSIPNFAQGLVEVCRAADRETPPPFGAQAWRGEGADAVWTVALQDRLSHIALDPNSPFISTRVARPEAYRAAAYTCVSAAPKPEAWREALAVIERETRRLSEYGVTEAEAERARFSLAAALDSGVAQSGTRRSEQIAASLLSTTLDDRLPVTPAEQRRTYALAAPHLTAQAATEAFRRRWSASAPLVVLASTVAASEADLKATWIEAKAQPSAGAPEIEKREPWAYASFGPPGQVVERQVLHDPDFVRVRFANGVKLNFKQAAFTQDRVDVRVRFGAGQQELDSGELAAGLLGARSFADGGLGRHDAETISRLFRGRLLSVDLNVERTRFTLSGVTRPDDFEAQAQLLSAYLVDPGFRPEVDLQVPTFAKLFFKSRSVEPLLAARAAIDGAAQAPHVFDPPPEPEFAALRATDFNHALRRAVTGDALEVTVVGDIDEETAVSVIARTFGALPPRDDTDHALPGAPKVRFGRAPVVPLRVRHEGLDSKAMVYVLWPLFPWEPARQLEIRQLTLLREVLGDEVRREIRERLGATYTPSVNLEIPYGGDECALSVAIETSPQSAEAVAVAVQTIALRLAAPQGVAYDVLERVRKPLLDDTARRKETNGWWLATLDGSWNEPYKLAQARTWRYDYATISVDEVQQSASRWLSQRPIVALALPETASASTPTVVAAQPDGRTAR